MKRYLPFHYYLHRARHAYFSTDWNYVPYTFGGLHVAAGLTEHMFAGCGARAVSVAQYVRAPGGEARAAALSGSCEIDPFILHNHWRETGPHASRASLRPLPTSPPPHTYLHYIQPVSRHGHLFVQIDTTGHKEYNPRTNSSTTTRVLTVE